MDLAAFRTAVAQYRRPTGHSQKDLAAALGLHPHVLSHKLHGSDNAALRHDEIRGIVRLLAAWQALTTRAQAVELLGLMDLQPNSFSDREWAVPPLTDLEADGAPSAGSGWAASAATTGQSQRGSLPADLTPLVGRREQVQQLVELLQGQARLVTLTGTGGVGKTRLAIAVAATLVKRAALPVCLVSLGAIRDSALVPGAVASELGLREPAGGGRRVQLAVLASLRDQRLLLVMDNLEQVLGASALIGELLRAAPEVRVLATSRVPLRIYGEHEVRVVPLRLPAPGAADLEVLRTEAVGLFVQRARAARPDFRPAPAQAALLSAICSRLDGLPLAIELAAARVRHLALPALLDRLERRLDVLDQGPRDVPARQRTLRATLDWSYKLLPGAQQRLFERLAVFVGGCTAEAVRAVCADDTNDVERGLWELVDAALLEAPDTRKAEQRFRMLETVREYALARLAASDQDNAMRAAHARYFLSLVEQGEHALLDNWSNLAWLQRLDSDYDNIRAAIRWASESHSLELELRLVTGVAFFRMLRGYWTEGLKDVLLALQHGWPGPLHLQARAHAYGAYMASTQNDNLTSQRLVDEGLPLGRAASDPQALAWLLYAQGALAGVQGRLAHSLESFTQAIALLEGAGGKPAGHLRALRRHYATSLLSSGQLDQSMQLHQQNLADALDAGDTYTAAAILVDIGTIALLWVDLQDAAGYFRHGLRLATQFGEPVIAQWCLDGLAVVAARQQDARKSAVLLGAADKLRDRLGFTAAFTHTLHTRIGLPAAIAAARAKLGEAAFDTARETGFTQSSDEALAEALAQS